MKTEMVCLWVCGLLLGLLLAFAAFLIPWHNFVCKKGHYADVHVGGMWTVVPIMINGQTGSTMQYVPSHDEQVWVCDEQTRRNR